MRRALASLLCAVAPLAAAQERMLFKEATVDVPVAEAWKAWATREGVQSFFAPEAVIDAKPDGAYAIHFNPYAPPGLRGADDMRVLAVQENRMISFTWNAPPQFPEARGQRTVVIVRTEPAGDKRTRVTLTHVGWGSGGQWDETFSYFDKAWSYVMASFQKRFAEGPVDWKPRLEQLRANQPGRK
ncbi:MAG TPA: SRPBCC domain-containing protein [Usitatibacter sp.]|nr:SRPBCC domain-containing protein [Usitatibacter sp.]